MILNLLLEARCDVKQQRVVKQGKKHQPEAQPDIDLVNAVDISGLDATGASRILPDGEDEDDVQINDQNYF